MYPYISQGVKSLDLLVKCAFHSVALSDGVVTNEKLIGANGSKQMSMVRGAVEFCKLTSAAEPSAHDHNERA